MGRCLKQRTAQYLSFALGTGHSGTCVLPSGGGHLHRLSLSREGSILSGQWRYQMVSDVSVSSW